MGWKNVREHYRIDHIVKVVDGALHIGSGYVGNLVTVTAEGVAEVNRTFAGAGELQRYRDEINSDPGLFRSLMAAPDVFAADIPVYTWKDGEIVAKLCEEFGWPNATHDGELMYENLFFRDRDMALRHALRDAAAAVEAYERNVGEARENLSRKEALLAEAREHQTMLLAEAEKTPVAVDV